MIRSSSLQWRKGRTRVMQDLSVQKTHNITPQSFTTDKHRKINSQVAQKDGQKTQITVSACRKTAARTKPWKVWKIWQMDLGKSTQQRQARFENQWHLTVVRTTAGASNTIPTRQHPELGQVHRARMECDSRQRVTASQSGGSSCQA